MSELKCEAEVRLEHLPSYLDKIEDRLESFQARASRGVHRVDFGFPFGEARFDMEPGRLVMKARAPDRDALARIKDLLATAIQVYAKAEAPRIRWIGDLANETQLPQFREMSVTTVTRLTSKMLRIRLAGDDLARFAKFGGMHIRMLFPTERVPEPEWPVLGENGLALWPAEDRHPTPRVYTIRRLDVERGWMDVDFIIHEGESVGSRWAEQARPGARVGIMGPVGRPVPLDAEWYVMGCDETGLPALSRLLETLPSQTSGAAFIETADEVERLPIDNRTAIEIRWIARNGIPAGEDARLAREVTAIVWPQAKQCFGWFAAENQAASLVRDHWRGILRLGRDSTLAASYWRRGAPA